MGKRERDKGKERRIKKERGVTDLPSSNVIVNVIEKSTDHLNCPNSASMDV